MAVTGTSKATKRVRSASPNPLDAQVTEITLFALPVETRVPLKFGTETLTSVRCLRTRVTVRGRDGRTASGWGETPCSVQWVWPSHLGYERRLELLNQLHQQIAEAWVAFAEYGHPLEVGYEFQQQVLPSLLATFNTALDPEWHVPYLAALLCCAPIDTAIHDAYGCLHELPVYETYGAPFLNRDLASFLHDDGLVDVDFSGKYPTDYLTRPTGTKLSAWHLVGGLDPVEPSELTGDEPQDGYPVLLRDWIERDGLNCLKIKLRGNDAEWDFARLATIGKIAQDRNVEWLTADYNCTVTDPQYVLSMLDRIEAEDPETYKRILYVEQPFPYDLEAHAINVAEIAARKPLLMDESAHDWQHVRLGRSLGWNGVALKTCKTQTGAILSLCWAKAHRMFTMVQDLTNPMLAQIPHVLLAAHAGTMMGVETNAMQFYPDASAAEAAVHPGLYRRVNGQVDFCTIRGPGFGYRNDEIERQLPEPMASFIAGART